MTVWQQPYKTFVEGCGCLHSYTRCLDNDTYVMA